MNNHWTKTATTIIPHSELAMHCKAAGRYIHAFARTGNDYVHIAFGDRNDPSFTHGLINELIPFGSDLDKQVKSSIIINSELLYGE